MNHQEIRKKFLDFFEKNGHKIVPSSSLIPEDKSVLFTTAGMQQFKPYYTNSETAPAKNVASIQKCMRTSDIDKVGDESHLTFFEMLGNFSFGGYGKKEAIEYAYQFTTKELGLKIDYVSVFGGEGDIPADEESEKIWKSIDPDIEVKRFDKASNFWGPTGDEGPCGPTTEIYANGTEVWNIVFNEYYCMSDKSYRKLERLGVDTGMGLERLSAVVNGKDNIFETELFEPIIKILPTDFKDKTKRIIVDHSRAVVFLLADGVRPSNKKQGYVLRRLMRRLITYQHLEESKSLFLNQESILGKIMEIYSEIYPEVRTMEIISEFKKERDIFNKTLKQGLNKFNDFVLRQEPKKGKIGVAHDQKILYGTDAFYLYQSFGFPREVMKDLCEENNIIFDEIGFEEEFKKHQEKSRASLEKKFKK